MSDRGFLFVNAADVGPTGAAMEEAGEGGELGRGSDGVDFDAPVVEVAGVAGEAQFSGGALGEVAISDTLNAARTYQRRVSSGLLIGLVTSGSDTPGKR